MQQPPTLTRYVALSIGAALSTIAIKTGAYLVSGSVGLLSDAYESGVNLAAALIALAAVHVAEQPADEGHGFGHGKAEYFSSGAEGVLIFVAAIAIVRSAIPRLIEPRPIESVGIGLGLSAVASLINFAVARVLLSAGRKHGSIALEADAHHLMTDVWTSGGVVVGVGLVKLTGWLVLDPIVAIGVALHILFAGYGLVRRSAAGLLDASLPESERAALVAVLERLSNDEGFSWHALRTRRGGRQNFAQVHVLVPGDWTVRRGHDLLERLECELCEAVPNLSVTTHLEPIEDPRAHEEPTLDGKQRAFSPPPGATG